MNAKNGEANSLKLFIMTKFHQYTTKELREIQTRRFALIALELSRININFKLNDND